MHGIICKATKKVPLFYTAIEIGDFLFSKLSGKLARDPALGKEMGRLLFAADSSMYRSLLDEGRRVHLEKRG